MAFSNRRRKGKKSKFTKVEKLAFEMGKVARGRSNPNSRITESYNKGKTAPTKKEKKPLF